MDIEQLLEAYGSAVEVDVLAQRFGVHRATVFNVVKRHGLQHRHPALQSDDALEAVALYEKGCSLAAVGEHLQVTANTVRTYLLRQGVAMRDTHARHK